MRNVFYSAAILGAAAILSSCASSQEQMDDNTGANAFMGSYLQVKDALFKGDPKMVTLKAGDMLKQVDNFSPADTAGWHDMSSELHTTLRDIVMAKEISDQRVDFERLSTLLYDNLDQYKLSNGTLYRAFCPMAFDNKGAYWITDKTEIENPYFGSEMPNCGEIRDTLNAK